jgi:hypothetical protein
MMEANILSSLASLGVGCILALVIFFMYRRECRAHHEQMLNFQENYRNQVREDRKYMEDRLTHLLEESFNIRKNYIEKMEEQTRVNAELLTYLMRQNGKKG